VHSSCLSVRAVPAKSSRPTPAHIATRAFDRVEPCPILQVGSASWLRTGRYLWSRSRWQKALGCGRTRLPTNLALQKSPPSRSSLPSRAFVTGLSNMNRHERQGCDGGESHRVSGQSLEPPGALYRCAAQVYKDTFKDATEKDDYPDFCTRALPSVAQLRKQTSGYRSKWFSNCGPPARRRAHLTRYRLVAADYLQCKASFSRKAWKLTRPQANLQCMVVYRLEGDGSRGTSWSRGERSFLSGAFHVRRILQSTMRSSPAEATLLTKTTEEGRSRHARAVPQKLGEASSGTVTNTA
jgi:hypothetical protein